MLILVRIKGPRLDGTHNMWRSWYENSTETIGVQLRQAAEDDALVVGVGRPAGAGALERARVDRKPVADRAGIMVDPGRGFWFGSESPPSPYLSRTGTFQRTGRVYYTDIVF